MDFQTPPKTTYTNIAAKEYFDGVCPTCQSKALKPRSSYTRTIVDLGSPREKRYVRIGVKYFICKDCGTQFSPKHPDYPPKLEYTPSIILYALERYYQGNVTAPQIADVLKNCHHVDVPPDTIYTWIKLHSEAYLNSIKKDKSLDEAELIKAVTIDGTFTSTGRDIIGKKKPVVSLSVTREKNGTYLLTLSEKRP